MGNHLDKPVLQKTTETSATNGLRFGASGMQGWRTGMEDAHSVVGSLGGALADHSWVGVYDGHGGERTAQIAAREMLCYVRRTPEFARYVAAYVAAAADDEESKDAESAAAAMAQLLGAAMRKGFLEFDKELQPKLLAAAAVDADNGGDVTSPGQQEQEGATADESGSTAVVVMITPSHMITANAGDSRAVYLRGTSSQSGYVEGSQAEEARGQVVALSMDHKPENEAERQRIEAAVRTFSCMWPVPARRLFVCRAFVRLCLRIPCPSRSIVL